MKYQSFVATLSFMYLFMPLLVSAQCEDLCTFNEEEQNKHGALKLKLVAITSILASSVIGVCLPILGRTISAVRPEKDVFFVIKAFAAGVILATGFIHVLPDAFDNLSSPCLKVNPWGNFPFAGFITMLSAIGTLMVDAFATIYYTRLKVDKAKLVSVGTGYEEKVGEELMTHVHVHGSGIVLEHNDSTGLIRHRIISQVLELGIVVHSIIIGISVGASQSSSTIRPLVAALSFHQFFEGMGLGGCICQAKFKVRAVTIMALFFSLTTPIGIALGIGISTVYNENSPSALIVEGIFNSASAGILIYMALVDLLAADFMSPKMQSSGKLQLWANSSLLIGAGLMSLLAKWA